MADNDPNNTAAYDLQPVAGNPFADADTAAWNAAVNPSTGRPEISVAKPAPSDPIDPIVSTPQQSPNYPRPPPPLQALGQAGADAIVKLATIPQRLMQSSEDLRQTGEYDPTPAGELMEAMMMRMPAAEVGSAGIFGGRLSATADIKALQQAQDMAAQGTHPLNIWHQTGWFQGPDAKWRYEIPDDALKVRPGAGVGIGPQSTIEHPELAQAYPQLSNLSSYIEKRPAGGGREGYYRGASPDNWVPDQPELRMASDPRLMRRSVAHELQHAVGDIEGFSPGTNPDAMRGEAERISQVLPSGRPTTVDDLAKEIYRRTAGEVESRNVEGRLALTPTGRAIAPPWWSADVPAKEQVVLPYVGRSQADVELRPVAGNPFGDDKQGGMAKGGTVKATKAQSHYRPGTAKARCGICTMFVAPSGCTAVRGFISPRAVCDYFEAKAKDAQTLYVMRPLLNAAAVIAWAKAHGFKKTLAADDMHVTIASSRAKVERGKIPPTLNSLIVTGGDRSVKRLGDEGAIVLTFESPALSARWKQIRSHGASWDWPSYQPHITITYEGADIHLEGLKPYLGPLKFGEEQFSEIDDDFKNKVQERASGGAVSHKVTIDRRYDVPYLAGSSNDSKTVYIDRRVPRKIAVRRASGKGYASIDPGEFLAAHEEAEHKAMNAGKPYEKAHVEDGTPAERALVKKHGIDWKSYEAVMDGLLSHIEHEHPKRPPPDLYKKPYPHHEELLLQRLGDRTGSKPEGARMTPTKRAS